MNAGTAAVQAEHLQVHIFMGNTRTCSSALRFLSISRGSLFFCTTFLFWSCTASQAYTARDKVKSIWPKLAHCSACGLAICTVGQQSTF